METRKLTLKDYYDVETTFDCPVGDNIEYVFLVLSGDQLVDVYENGKPLMGFDSCHTYRRMSYYDESLLFKDFDSLVNYVSNY